MDVLSKTKISSFFIRDLDGIFKKIPSNAKEILLSPIISKREKRDFFLNGKIPQRTSEISEFISKTSWLEIETQAKFFHLCIFVKPKVSDIKIQKIGKSLGEKLLFAFIIPQGSKAVLIDRDKAIGDCDILNFFI